MGESPHEGNRYLLLVVNRAIKLACGYPLTAKYAESVAKYAESVLMFCVLRSTIHME